MKQPLNKVGIVVIGRNEGERLKRCLRSVCEEMEKIVYVDSGSTDGSIEFAKSIGVDVVELDMSLPFTMARGRNAGFERVLDVSPDTELVQFIDGDCELVDGYIENAAQTMQSQKDVTVVTGRRIERFPEASIYNRLCEIEWGREIGEIMSCGGDMMVRVRAFKEAGMFNPGMIAGEEPELCVRLREAGGKIVRIDHDMTIHDAAMKRFSQWWKRAVRGGHAYAEGYAIHGRPPHRHNLRKVRSALFWGAALPSLAIVSAIAAVWWPFMWLWTTFLFLAYLFLAAKINRDIQQRGLNPFDARIYAIACVVGKFPRCLGILHYWANRIFHKQSKLIEY